MERIGAYPGRFQVIGLHHLEVVRDICHNHALDVLYVLVADWKERTRENPLTADEAIQCINLSLTDFSVSAKILVRSFPLTPKQSFNIQLRVGLERLGPGFVFSGSVSTLTAARLCAKDLGITVVELVESGLCHSSDIRQWIAEGNGKWKQHVAPSAMAYLESLNLPERLRILDEGEKRPWVKSS